jgi:formylglycine-generating enzyme required for sulfatase activity
MKNPILGKFLGSAIVAGAIIISGCSIRRQVAEVAGSIEFVEIPSGTYTMGADLDPKYITSGSEEGWRSIFIQDEFPVRNVTISKDFEISTYEITNAQYKAFDPGHKKWRGNFVDLSTEDDEAVIYVSWEEAVADRSFVHTQPLPNHCMV